MRYIPKYFKPQEFLPNDLYAIYGVEGLYLMDDRILWTMDALRSYFNKPITINNFFNGGSYNQRGYRNDTNVGAKFSAHRYGRACDADVSGYTAEEVRQVIKDGKLGDIMKYITRIEDNVNWLHLDCMGLPRETGQPIEFFHA